MEKIPSQEYPGRQGGRQAGQLVDSEYASRLRNERAKTLYTSTQMRTLDNVMMDTGAAGGKQGGGGRKTW